jgi:ribosomal protein S25
MEDNLDDNSMPADASQPEGNQTEESAPGAPTGDGADLGAESTNIPPQTESETHANLGPVEGQNEAIPASDPPTHEASEGQGPATTPMAEEPTNPSSPETSASQGAQTPPPQDSFIKNLLAKAGQKIQFNKNKKLNKIMELVGQKGKISNKEVCEALRVSDSTAVRYLNILERQGRIKQVGETGRDSFYQLPS